MKKNKFLAVAYGILPIATVSISPSSFAEEQLETINVETSAVQSGAAESQTIRKTHKAIQQEMIRDTRDLVRYTTDVGVADNGRRLKGFSMRGVEGNRVGISIDGVSLPDFEENSLYARYGNFNNSRVSIDSELVRSIDIVKGSDSVNMGSGYLGGGVNYRTMNVEDLVFSGKSVGGLLRSGYASKNREWVHTAGVGATNDNFGNTNCCSKNAKSISENTHDSSFFARPSQGDQYTYLSSTERGLSRRHVVPVGADVTNVTH